MSDVKEKTVHDQLFEAAQGFTPEGKKKFTHQTAKETDAEYMSRLLERVSELPKPNYDALPEGTVHAWFEKAAAAFNAQEPIPAPEGFESKFKAPAEAQPKASEAKAAEGKEPAAPAVRKRAEITVGKVIRQALVLDQATSLDAIKEKLAVAGFKDVKPTTIGSYMSDALATLSVAAEMGKFAPNPAPASKG